MFGISRKCSKKSIISISTSMILKYTKTNKHILKSNNDLTENKTCKMETRTHDYFDKRINFCLKTNLNTTRGSLAKSKAIVFPW